MPTLINTSKLPQINMFSPVENGGAFRDKFRANAAAHMRTVRCDKEQGKEIRQRVLMNGRSKRAACEKYGLGWQTLNKILAHAEPPGYRQRQCRPKRVLGSGR